jgi:hypothetical protein
MITNFEEFTANLKDEEIAIVPIVVQVLQCASELNQYKAPLIVAKVQAVLGINQIRIPFNERKLRKCVNYIRVNGIVPLIATSSGYYITNDARVIRKQINSLDQRARSITMCANGLTKWL